MPGYTSIPKSANPIIPDWPSGIPSELCDMSGGWKQVYKLCSVPLMFEEAAGPKLQTRPIYARLPEAPVESKPDETFHGLVERSKKLPEETLRIFQSTFRDYQYGFLMHTEPGNFVVR